MEADAVFHVDSRLDPFALRDEFRAQRRLSVHGFVRTASANALYRCLAIDTRFALTVSDGKDVWSLPHSDRVNVTDMEESEINQIAYGAAIDRFAYVYESGGVYDHLKPETTSEAGLLSDFVRFLNSEALIEFVRLVSASAEIESASVEARCYRAGHFVGAQRDRDASRRSRIGFVFNLTPRWRVEWGGLLQFHGSNGHICGAYTPRFNELWLYRIPQVRSVSYVSDFAPDPQLCITGFFQSS